MAKKTTVTKGRKRGPKEKRLVITEDPETALARLLNPPASAAFWKRAKRGIDHLPDDLAKAIRQGRKK